MSEMAENTRPFPPDDDDSEADGERPELPPPNFDFLVYSLRLQAEMNLGMLAFDDKHEPDFELARHNIDLLAMLKQKTKGNLDLDEQRELDNALTELRFSFEQATQQVPGA